MNVFVQTFIRSFDMLTRKFRSTREGLFDSGIALEIFQRIVKEMTSSIEISFHYSVSIRKIYIAPFWKLVYPTRRSLKFYETRMFSNLLKAESLIELLANLVARVAKMQKYKFVSIYFCSTINQIFQNLVSGRLIFHATIFEYL